MLTSNAASGSDPAQALLPSPLRPYVHQPAMLLAVFATFAAVTLPMTAWGWWRYAGQTGGTAAMYASVPVLVYLGVFGITHFWLTFTVYLHAANRAYFSSDARRVLTCWVLPFGALIGLGLYNGLGLPEQLVTATLVLTMAIRAFDFFHLSRQSFGVLQLMKGKLPLARWSRRAENLYFLSYVPLLFHTFLTGHFRLTPASMVLGATTAALGLLVVSAYLRAASAGGEWKVVAVALAYLTVQSASALLAVAWIGFYAFTLAIHYAEYHVLMAPRWRHQPLDEGRVPDRWFRRLRRHPLLLYALLLALAASVLLLRAHAGEPHGAGRRLLVHAFDGLFVFHYLIEMQIWKFSDPYIRSTIGPLYFPRR